MKDLQGFTFFYTWHDVAASLQSRAPTACWCAAAAVQALFVLFESASGFALFDIKGLDEIGQAAEKVQESIG